ncbi:MAG: DUF2335 domain-containing protein [Gammaproteobacteria bacterium]
MNNMNKETVTTPRALRAGRTVGKQVAHHVGASNRITKIGDILPHPRELAKYEDILPGAANRFMTMLENKHQSDLRMAEKAQQARLNMAEKTHENETRRIIVNFLVNFLLNFASLTFIGIMAWKSSIIIAAPFAVFPVVSVLPSILRELRLWWESRAKPKA